MFRLSEENKQKFWTIFWSAGCGIVVGAFVLAHTPFNFVSPSTAKQQASDAAQAAVTQALAPLCAEKFTANADAYAKFAKSNDQEELIQNTVKKIGITEVDYQLADACAEAVKAKLQKAEVPQKKS